MKARGRTYHGKRTAVRRRPRSVPRGGKKSGEVSALQRRQMMQLVVAGGIFVLLVVMKLLAPQSFSALAASVRETLGQNADFKAAFSAVGEAVAGEKAVGESLEDAYMAVFAPARYQADRTAAVLATAGGLTLPADQLARQMERGGPARRVIQKPEAEELETLVTQSLIHFNNAAPANVTFSQQVLGFEYTTPVEGTLTSAFGYRDHPIYGEERFHYGLDIANVQGTEIDAFAAGKVKATGESSSLGKYLMISHPNNITTLYAHCSRVNVTAGTEVGLGQKVAEMGSTGGATGTHLHFEIMDGVTYLNPIYYVEVH